MVIAGLFHVAIKTNDLSLTKHFYCDVLGLKEIFRPDFGFPGAWIACPIPGGQAIIHVYAGGPVFAADGKAPIGSGAIDHISLSCSGYHEFRGRFADMGFPYREFLVPGTTLWQLFVYDPSGVQLELTFEGAMEKGPEPDMSPGKRYVPGANFFDAQSYPKLGARITA